MVFAEKPTAIIWAKDTASGDFLSIGGVTAGATTLANAAEQINKILAIVGKSVTPDGMTRIKTEGGVDNG